MQGGGASPEPISNCLARNRMATSLSRPELSRMLSRLDLGPKPRLGYTASLIDRAAHARNDADLLTRALSDAAATIYAISGEQIVLKRTPVGFDPKFLPAEAQALGAFDETIFLGFREGSPVLAAGIEYEALRGLEARADLFLTDLRSIAVQGLVDEDHLPPIAEAKAMLHWHARHRFCANCGVESKVTEGGWRRDCGACGAQHFPRTDPVVIMLAIAGDHCLLGRQSRFVPNLWSCLAGFVEPGETIEEAVRRETSEEAGITCGQVTYFASQPWPFPSSLMIGAHAQALSREITIDPKELEDARWFDRDEIVAMLLRRHNDGLTVPPPVAIAHHIIRAWVEGEVGFAD